MGGPSFSPSSYRSSTTSYSPRKSIERDHLENVQVSHIRRSGDPENRPINRGVISTDSPNPVIIAFDDTGSMGSWVDEFYKRAPMFFGRLVLQNYLADPALSFIAVGDQTCDDEGLQVTPFARGDEIDDHLQSLFIEKGGGGGIKESYELAAYFGANKTDFTSKLDAKPLFFFFGDESFYETIPQSRAKVVFGDDLQSKLKSSDVFDDLMNKFDVYAIRRPYQSSSHERDIRDMWENTLGKEKVVMLSDPG